MRTYIVVLATVPLVWVRVILVVYPEPEVVDISKPVGADIDILAANPDPLAVKLWAADTDPEIEEKVFNEPVVDIVGPAATV
jgi:hypothetical protein